MSVLYIMLPAAFLIAGAAVFAFVRTAKSGQYDDLDTPAYRVLMDDERLPKGQGETWAEHDHR